MNDIIYENLEAAKLACKEYAKVVIALQNKLGIWDSGDDEGRISTRYRDVSGVEKLFSTYVIDEADDFRSKRTPI